MQPHLQSIIDHSMTTQPETVPDYGIDSDHDEPKAAKIGNTSGLYPIDYIVDTSEPTSAAGTNLC